MEPAKKSVAIIGAGFGGLTAAKILANSKHLDVHIFDRRNHHLFQPLLYQVAMAGLNPSDVAIPIRRLFNRSASIDIVMAEVESVDIVNSKIKFDDAWKNFDYIIIACGTKHSYFGRNEWEVMAPGLKNIEQATEIRRRILTAFELAEKETNKASQESFLSFAIIGGGPTGVELAGAIAEMAKCTLSDDYKKANLRLTKVFLIESGPRILPTFPERLSKMAKKELEDVGVTVLEKSHASDLSLEGLKANQEWINCKTIIWAAGVRPVTLAENISSEKDKQGRLNVLHDLSLPTNKNIFAVGDVAAFKTNEGQPLPGIAPVAVQQGRFVAKQILNDIDSKPRGHFKYWDKGMMATIGRSRAVVVSGKLQLSGFLAWLAWVFVHVIYLMRFKNRVFVFFQWVWGYFSFGHGARLITHKTWRFYSANKISYRIDKDHFDH
ncbi:MAG: NAD(P)/FAD-dependent oxidoreductase [Oligoflexia bacterium]|nr:NAD(P)/FAD-dependent oxidoreductase [Oligoflexia bacterium]